MLQMLLVDTEKNTAFGECKIVIISFLLIADTDRQELLTECDGNAGRPRSARNVPQEEQIFEVAERQPTVSIPYILHFV
jgi:hypothetical protein